MTAKAGARDKNGRFSKSSNGWAFSPVTAAAAIGAGALAVAAVEGLRRFLRSDYGHHGGAVAFAKGETDRENLDQTRSAGPDGMRSNHKDWDKVDQASDESFPASDPMGA